MDNSENDSKSKSGLPPGWTRKTILVREEHFEKLKAFAFWGQMPLKDVVDRMFEEFFSTKTVNPIPKAEKADLDKLFSVTTHETK